MGEHPSFLQTLYTTSSIDPSAYQLMRAAPLVLRGPAEQRILHWPDIEAASRLFHVEKIDLPETEPDLALILPPNALRARRAAIADLQYDGATYSVTYDIKNEKGQSKWIEERGQRLSGQGTQADHIQAALIDVTEITENRKRVSYESRYDGLTGFAQRGPLAEHLSYYKRFGQAAQIYRIHIKNLSDIEALFGPEAVDYYVQAISRRVSGEFSKTDFRARPTHDMLCIVPSRNAGLGNLNDNLPDTKKLTYILGDIPVESPFGRVPLDCDVDIILFEPEMAVEPFISELVDEPEYTSTDPVTDTELQTVSPASRPAAAPLYSLNIDEAFINTALLEQRITLAYQPIVETRTGDLSHYEALMRYMDDTGRAVSAAPLILAAEKLGLIHKLDMLVLDQATTVLLENPKIVLGLNVSAATFGRMDSMMAYLALLKRLGPDANRVVIELTETMALENPELANQFAIRLQSLGCRFAIDDFGTGHTSFQNLLNLEAQIIKIDGSYIQDIAYRDQRQSYVRLIVEMAQTFGLKTVAEMIDNEQDAAMCARLGVDYLQGYYIGKPQLYL